MMLRYREQLPATLLLFWFLWSLVLYSRNLARHFPQRHLPELPFPTNSTGSNYEHAPLPTPLMFSTLHPLTNTPRPRPLRAPIPLASCTSSGVGVPLSGERIADGPRGSVLRRLLLFLGSVIGGGERVRARQTQHRCQSHPGTSGVAQSAPRVFSAGVRCFSLCSASSLFSFQHQLLQRCAALVFN